MQARVKFFVQGCDVEDDVGIYWFLLGNVTVPKIVLKNGLALADNGGGETSDT